MPQGPDGKTVIIVKKVAGHGGHHGGSWKVAFADFVTSMMCFFMVLWLVNSASVTTRERIASYFRAAGIFEKGSGTPLEMGGSGILPDTFSPPGEANSTFVPSKRIYEIEKEEGEKLDAFGTGGGEGSQAQGQEARRDPKQEEQLEELANQLKKAIARDQQVIAGFIGQMDVKLDQRGLHLEIMDTPTASMFARGSAAILPEAAAELERIGLLLQKIPNPVDIEGHTDGAPFRGPAAETRDNWILSMERANAARRLLLGAGMRDDQVARVVGYADKRPKVPQEPLNPSNRRISISMRYTEQAAVTLKETKPIETRSKPLRLGAEPEDATPQKGLRLEVTTTDEAQPAPTPVAVPAELPNRPIWREKDYIFGERDPFFGR